MTLWFRINPVQNAAQQEPRAGQLDFRQPVVRALAQFAKNEADFIFPGLTAVDHLAMVSPLRMAHARRFRAVARRTPKGLGPVSRLITSRTIVSSLCLAALAGVWSCWAFGQSTGTAEYEVYPCRFKDARDVEKLLVDLLPHERNVHLMVDPKSNALLLRGPAEVQNIAKTLLQHVDRPADPATPATIRPAVVTAYDVRANDWERAVAVMRSVCDPHPDVKLTFSQNSGQIIVLAPPEIQSAIAAGLGGMHRPPAAATGSSPASGPAAASNTDTDRLLQLRTLDAQGMEQRLIALFGRRLHLARREGADVYVLPVGPHRALEFILDRSRKMVRVRGPEAPVAQFAALVDALDAGGQPGRKTRALHVQRAAPEQLQEAVDAYRGRTPGSTPRGPQRDDQSQHLPPAGHTPVRLVNYLQPSQPGLGDLIPMTDGGDDMGTVVPSVPGLDDLEVQTLPELDVIILRGRDQDVEQLTKIIRELERLSAETKPRIYIYQLEYTLGSSMAAIIEQVQTDLVGRRQGRVTVTPLVKPNALLLIGWGEAVESIIELIGRLDQPVSPESQFSVFALKHAAASTVQQTITQFFAARTGLAPLVRVAINARTNSLIVYAAPRDMAEVQRLVRELDIPQSGAVNRAQIFRVYNALAVDVADTLEQTISAAQTGQTGRSAVLELMAIDEQGRQALQSGMLNEVNITTNPRTNTLIVTGPPEAMPLVEAFIKQLDAPGDRAQIKVFRIINGDATNLVLMLRSLLPSQVGADARLQLPAAPDEASLAPLRFSVEVRSNSIIAIGSEGDLRIVEALITRLDQSESMNRRSAVYMLKNSSAIDVATSINQFIQSQRQLEAAEPGQSNPFQDLEREVIVVAEPVGNRLIVSATPRYFDEITQLIEQLDEPPPQVMIQVLIAEVRLGDRDELGVELGLQDSILFDRSLLGDLITTTTTTQVSDPNGILTTTEEIVRAASLTPGFDFNNRPLGNSGADSSLDTASHVGGQALSNFSLGRMNDDAGFGGMVLSASSQNINILIRALQETREMRILSRPVVRTLDNQPAFIQVGERVPRIVGSTLNMNGQSNSISLENVGLILGVTPRISPDGNVVMEIDAEKSKVGPEAEGIPVALSIDGTVIRSPRVDTITAQATVSCATGETIVLGGIIATEKESVTRRAPFLSDIPVLGHLFRFDSTNEKRTELLIILTPHVIRNKEDGERIKQAEFARMSWCAADVYQLYGDVGISFPANLDTEADDVHTEVIYPTLNPRGELPATPTPATPGPPTAPPAGDAAGLPIYGPQPPPALWNDTQR